MAEDAQQIEKRQDGLDALSIARQVILLVGLAGSFALAYWIIVWLQEPNYSILFGNLEDSETSVVLEALAQLNIEYKLDNNTGALMVPSKDVHDARIKLAAQGLPKSNIGGFNVLSDETSGFGVSEAMEQARFQRMLEVELAKTITHINNIKSARIHLAIPKSSVFIRKRQKPRASIVVSLYQGRPLGTGQVTAISHLVASSVPGLDMEHVTVVDQNGRLLTNGESSKDMALTGSQFDYARKLEKSYIDRIEDILTPILGPDSVRAQVTADIDFTFSEQTQESFNPDAPALRSNLTQEESSVGSAVAGVPGALTNQPGTQAQAPEKARTEDTSGNKNANSRNSRRETRNYELDKTISHTRFAMGRIRRLSTAVVVDDRLIAGDNGEIIRTPRSPEEIERITDLVKKAIGFSLQRGDSVNVMNESFTVATAPEPLPDPPIWEQPWVWDLVKQIMGVVLVLVIGFGVVKPLWKSLMRTMPVVTALQPPPALANNSSGELQSDSVTLTGEEETKRLAGPQTQNERNMEIAQSAVAQDPKLVAQVVKNWVTEDE